jgi:thiol-disulfide isomerase/thioredoxin/outer membrane murein-binding lipoprotein Lpp
MKILHIIACLLLAGCATADRVQQLEDKLTALEGEIAKLEKKGPASKPTAGDDAASDADENAAREMFTEVNALMKEGKMDEAKAKIAAMEKKYSSTKTWRRARKVSAELEVIGKDSGDIEVEKWLQGDAVDFSSSKPTMVVFWEIWCPHCKREVPQLQATYDEYKGKGLQMVGLTKMTRSATEEKVQEFIKEKNVSYPMAKESGNMSKKFNVSGIPAAAVVKEGKIVWRGHPARLSKEMIEGWL